MQTKTSIKLFLLTLTIFGVLVISLTLTSQFQAKPVENTSLAFDSNIQFDIPVRLKIPKIDVDANINPMGITQDGAMEAPVGGKDVGWYKYGAFPGEEGTAVIAGHFGRWKNGDGSVFDRLSSLNEGDIFYVEDKNGITISFKVREIRNFDPEADSAEVFSSTDGKSHLNLITCQGAWNKETKSYPARLVVFSDKNE